MHMLITSRGTVACAALSQQTVELVTPAILRTATKELLNTLTAAVYVSVWTDLVSGVISELCKIPKSQEIFC